MTVTAASVKAIATELSSVDDADFTVLLAMAERRVNRTQWGESKADDGVIFLTAHLMTLQRAAAAATVATVRGPLTSETMGPISRSFAAPPAPRVFTDAWYALSSWGLAFAELRAQVFPDRVGDA